MASREGVLNQMTAKLVKSTQVEFATEALDEWAEIFNETVGRNLDKNGTDAWDKKGARFVLRVVVLTARRAARMADASEEVMISAETLRAAAEYEIKDNQNKHCPADSGGVRPLGVWCPDE